MADSTRITGIELVGSVHSGVAGLRITRGRNFSVAVVSDMDSPLAEDWLCDSLIAMQPTDPHNEIWPVEWRDAS